MFIQNDGLINDINGVFCSSVALGVQKMDRPHFFFLNVCTKYWRCLLISLMQM